MARIYLASAWITLAKDLTQSVQVLYTGTPSHNSEGQGRIGKYAGGRTRAIRKAGQTRSVTIPGTVSPADLARLESWVGSEVLYRDGLGTRWWGVYWAVPWTASENGRERNISLAIGEVTYPVVTG